MNYVLQCSPYRILEETGGAYAMGAIGGSIWHGAKGFLNSPRGDRLSGSLLSLRQRAPLTGGSFASWAFTFSVLDCMIISARHGKEDPWNSIVAGAGSGAILAARGGAGAMTRGALIGGVLLAMIEGVAVAMNRVFAESYRPRHPGPPANA